MVLVSGGSTVDTEMYSVFSNMWTVMAPVPGTAPFTSIQEWSFLGVLDNIGNVLYQYSLEGDTWTGLDITVTRGFKTSSTNAVIVSERQLAHNLTCT